MDTRLTSANQWGVMRMKIGSSGGPILKPLNNKIIYIGLDL